MIKTIFNNVEKPTQQQQKKKKKKKINDGENPQIIWKKHT